MAIDRALLAKKLDFLSEHLTKIEYMEFNEKEFVESVDIHDLITFRLQQAVETCIDIATHIIASLSLKRTETAKDAFLLLGQKRIINKKLASRMGKASDFRNRVVHGYNDFDFKMLFHDYKENIKDLRQFGAEILAFLEDNEQV